MIMYLWPYAHDIISDYVLLFASARKAFLPTVLKSNINTFSVRYRFYWTIWFSHHSYEWKHQRCLEISIHLRIPLKHDNQFLLLFREIRSTMKSNASRKREIKLIDSIYPDIVERHNENKKSFDDSFHSPFICNRMSFVNQRTHRDKKKTSPAPHHLIFIHLFLLFGGILYLLLIYPLMPS